MTPGRSNPTAHLLTAAMFFSNSAPVLPRIWGQFNLKLMDYHSDPVEVSSTLWIPDITDRWRQQEDRHTKYADLSNVACNSFSILQHGIGVEACFPMRQDVIGWRQSITTGETLGKGIVVRQVAWPNNGILADENPALDTTTTENDLEMTREAEERQLRRIAMVHIFLEMWQGSQNLCATQIESRAQNMQMTALG